MNLVIDRDGNAILVLVEKNMNYSLMLKLRYGEESHASCQKCVEASATIEGESAEDDHH